MFSARLGSRLARLGNFVLGYKGLPFVPPMVFGVRGNGNANLQASKRAAQVSAARNANVQVTARALNVSASRRSNTQSSRRR